MLKFIPAAVAAVIILGIYSFDAMAACPSTITWTGALSTNYTMTGVTDTNSNCAMYSVPAVGATPSPVGAANPLPVTPGTGVSFPVTTGVNVTPTDCSNSISTGGTAQTAIAAQTTLHGFTIANIDSTTGSGEVLWISLTGIAVAGAAASYPLAPPAATTFANLSSYTTPPGFGINHLISIIAATTGHKYSCTWW